MENIKTGLVSVTFRNLSPQRIVDLVAEAKLDGIEWGGDIHVPHGQIQTARDVHRITVEAGLSVAAYGSYYRAGENKAENSTSFTAVLDSACELEAPTIRVWAGTKGSAEADKTCRAHVADDLRTIGERAEKEGVTVSLEHHAHTLTDTLESTQSLLQAVQCGNVRPYWQVPHDITVAKSLAGLITLLPTLTHVHVYHWRRLRGEMEQLPLTEGESSWQQYLQALATTGRKHGALLEFVRDECPKQFAQDAQTLRRWLGISDHNQ